MWRAEATWADYPAHRVLKTASKLSIDEAWQIINRDYVDDALTRSIGEALRQDLLGRENTSKRPLWGPAGCSALRRSMTPNTRFLLAG
jgi:carboxyl-terminal processing protease